MPVKATGLLSNERGEYLRPQHGAIRRGGYTKLSQKSANVETILVPGRCCESNHARQMTVEIVDPSIQFVGWLYA
jgi:hypothetical protein